MTPFILVDVLLGFVVGIIFCGSLWVICLAIESWKEVKIEQSRLEAFSKFPAPQINIIKQQEETDESDWWKRGAE